MSDTTDPITLLQQFLAAIAPLSNRQAVLQTGLSLETLRGLKRRAAWGRPLPQIQRRVQRKMAAYLAGTPLRETGDTRQTTVQRIKALEARVAGLEEYIAWLNDAGHLPRY